MLPVALLEKQQKNREPGDYCIRLILSGPTGGAGGGRRSARGGGGGVRVRGAQGGRSDDPEGLYFFMVSSIFPLREGI